MFDAAVVNEGLGQAAEEAGKSPDGLGAFVVQDGNHLPPPQPTQPRWAPPADPQQLQGEIDFLEPDDTSGGSAVRSAGFTLLFVGLSTAVGFALARGLGAASGLLLSAGVANAYRSQKWWGSPEPSEKHEAVVSGLFSVAELGTGLFVAYRAYQLGEGAKRE